MFFVIVSKTGPHMLLLAALLEINELNLLSLVNDKLVVKHLLYLYRRMQEMATVDNGTMGMENCLPIHGFLWLYVARHSISVHLKNDKLLHGLAGCHW